MGSFNARLAAAEKAAKALQTDIERLWVGAGDSGRQPLEVNGEWSEPGTAPAPTIKRLTTYGNGSDYGQPRIAVTPLVPYTGGATIETATYTLVASGWSHNGNTSMNGSKTLVLASTESFGFPSFIMVGSTIPLYPGAGVYVDNFGLGYRWSFRNGPPGVAMLGGGFVSVGNLIKLTSSFLDIARVYFDSDGSLKVISGYGFTVGTLSITQN